MGPFARNLSTPFILGPIFPPIFPQAHRSGRKSWTEDFKGGEREAGQQLLQVTCKLVNWRKLFKYWLNRRVVYPYDASQDCPSFLVLSGVFSQATRFCVYDFFKKMLSLPRVLGSHSHRVILISQTWVPTKCQAHNVLFLDFRCPCPSNLFLLHTLITGTQEEIWSHRGLKRYALDALFFLEVFPPVKMQTALERIILDPYPV